MTSKTTTSHEATGTSARPKARDFVLASLRAYKDRELAMSDFVVLQRDWKPFDRTRLLSILDELIVDGLVERYATSGSRRLYYAITEKGLEPDN